MSNLHFLGIVAILIVFQVIVGIQFYFVQEQNEQLHDDVKKILLVMKYQSHEYEGELNFDITDCEYGVFNSENSERCMTGEEFEEAMQVVQYYRGSGSMIAYKTELEGDFVGKN